MNETILQRPIPPWYRQGWPWLLIALPASAVVAGILTLIIALHSPNALVVDDYYKEGLAINQEKHRLKHAAEMQLSGLLRGDRNNLTLSLYAREPISENTLQLRITHATRSELDQTIMVKRGADGSYRGQYAKLKRGYWYLLLQNPGRTWEIRSRTHIDGAFQSHLSTARD